MKHAHIAFLILVPVALATTGCQNTNQTFAAWPFRSGTSAADFSGQATAAADPFQRERNRLANEALLAERVQQNQQLRSPQQFASNEPVGGPTNMQPSGTQSAGAQPFPSDVTQASHEQTGNGNSTATSGNPFAQSAPKSQWHSRETRTAAKVE